MGVRLEISRGICDLMKSEMKMGCFHRNVEFVVSALKKNGNLLLLCIQRVYRIIDIEILYNNFESILRNFSKKGMGT